MTQNDIVLLSLVRTKAVGHLRDVRRLIVALSRARLGLYVFCRTAVFNNCFELRPGDHHRPAAATQLSRSRCRLRKRRLVADPWVLLPQRLRN